MANGMEKTMDYEAVASIRSGFLQAADVCKKVKQGLTAAIQALKLAFLAGPAVKAAEKWLQGIKSAVNELEQELRELSDDLEKSIQEHKQAEEEAAGGFAG